MWRRLFDDQRDFWTYAKNKDKANRLLEKKNPDPSQSALFVHFKEPAVRTVSLVNDPSLFSRLGNSFEVRAHSIVTSE